MNTEQQMRFAIRMRIFLGLFWLGSLVLGAAFIGIFTLRPLDEHISVLTAAACTGFGVMAIGSLGRAASRCPQCSKLFSGHFENSEGGSASVFASSCRHCGFRTNRSQ